MADLTKNPSGKYSLKLSLSEAIMLKTSLETHVQQAAKQEMFNRLTTHKDCIVNLFESVLSEFFTKHYMKFAIPQQEVKLTIKRSEALALMQFLAMNENESGLLNIKCSLHKLLV